MTRDLERYRELVVEGMNMFAGYNFSKVITFDEYVEFNNLGMAIEEILEAKYGEKEVNKVRCSTI